MWDVPDRWDVTKSHRGFSRVEIWSKGQLVTNNAPILDGKVTEKRVSGIRMNLSLTLDPSPAAYKWMRLPALEIRPYSGIDWGSSKFEVPLGRYPLLPPPLALPRAGISITADDYWSRMTQYKLTYAIYSYPDHGEYRIIDAAARLISDVNPEFAAIGYPQILATNGSMNVVTLWDKDKTASELVVAMMDPIGAEVFYNRLGVCIIQDKVTTPGTPMTTGNGGTIISFTTTQDWTDVYNEVACYSSNNDVNFGAAVATITDPNHPAYWANGLGRKGFTMSSPYFADYAAANRLSSFIVNQKANPALSWTITAIPDVSRMAGDKFPVTTDLGTVNAVIQEVTHDLAGGPMSITLNAADQWAPL